jgi:microsomal dipeptidase-like Zn-dependent dipeptidase
MLIIVAGVGFFVGAAPITERRMNTIARGTARVPSEKALALHKKATIADLHADTLLWGRDLLARASRGHVDLPRLVDGNVGVQVFGIVTKTPRGMNIEKNDDSTDNILPLAVAEHWPPRTWRKLVERALYQATRLSEAASMSGGRLRLVTTAGQLKAVLDERQRGEAVVAALIGVEGAQALDGDLANLDRLFAAGVRMMAPSHFYDTDVGGSAAGVHKGALTPLGLRWLAAMEERRMIVDLAHASTATIDDVLTRARRPVVVSHTGVRGTCDNNRNLSDEQLRRIAAGGGLVGIGFWDVATCGHDAAAIARAIVYAVKVAGPDHVALGSDFDGAIEAPFDAAGLAQLTDALLAAGLSEEVVEKVLGKNAISFLINNLPQ